MEIVIKIPDDMIKSLEQGNFGAKYNIYDLVGYLMNGTPLPKEHGKLSDMDELVKNIVKEYGVNSIHELPRDIKIFYDKFINSAPTILDATFDYKLKNYAFFRKEEV